MSQLSLLGLLPGAWVTQWQLCSLQTRQERVKTRESCVLEHHTAHGKRLLRARE